MGYVKTGDEWKINEQMTLIHLLEIKWFKPYNTNLICVLKYRNYTVGKNGMY